MNIGHKSVVSELLAAGADKDEATKDGATPLYVAALNGNTEVVAESGRKPSGAAS